MTAFEPLVLTRLWAALDPSIRSLLTGCTLVLRGKSLLVCCPSRKAFDLAIAFRTHLAAVADRFGVAALEFHHQDQRVCVAIELVLWLKGRSLLVVGNTVQCVPFDS